jgi:HK97 family phage prohead protease
MDKQSFRFEIKDVDAEAGTFSGLASTYGNVDLGGDVVQRGAFDRSLQNAKGPWPLLAGHDPSEQIGYATLEDTPQGLKVNGQLVLHTEKARQVYALMKARALRGLSIGYDTVKSAMQNGVRHLTEIKLFEISVTAFPMNELATVSAVKSSDDRDAVARFRKTLELCTKEIVRK